MDVASLVVVWSLLGQAGADPFGGQAPPVPNVAAPANGSPRYGNAPPNGAGDRYAQPPGYGAPTSAPPNYGPPNNAGAMSAQPRNAPSMGATQQPSYAAQPNYATQPAASPNYAAQPNYATPAYGAPTGSAVPTAATAPAQLEDKSGAGDLVRESLVLPKSLAVPGRVTSLDEIFGNLGDRRRQIDAVRSYWKLTADVADYHFAWQQTQFLKLLSEVVDGVEKGPDLQRAKTETTSRYAEAQARQREAEMRIASTQFELAERASLSTGNRQPLPRDLPHVGVYNTYLEKVYAHRTPPARAYLLNRTLPLWRDIIATRAETVWASQDAYDAAFDAYRKGQLEVDDVFLAVEELRERRSEFIGAVRRYNEEIAEYALTSAPDGTSRETLVGMLIKNSHTPKLGRAAVPTGGGEVEQVVYVDEFGNPVAAPIGEEEETSQPVLIEKQAATDLPKSILPSNAAPSNIALMSATVPVANLDETSAGAAVPPVRDVPVQVPVAVPLNFLPGAAAQPNMFQPAATAMPIQGPASPFPNAGATPTRGQPTLAPPQKPTDEAPLKFKVNKPRIGEVDPRSEVPTEPKHAPRQLPDEVHHEARPIPPATSFTSSPYSSGTHPKKRPKAAPHVASPIGATAPIATSPTTTAPATMSPVTNASLTTPPTVAPQTGAAPSGRVVGEALATSGPELKPAAVHVDPEVEQAGYYTQLAQFSSAQRTQELVELLHGARGLPASNDKPVTLDECMAGSEPSHRREIITAYWRAAEQATRYRVWTQKLERLEMLSQSALQFRDKPAGSIAMLQIRAERLAIEAGRRTNLVDLAVEQWTLTNDARRSLAGPWLMPSTSPHAGSYQTKLEGLPPATGNSPRLQAYAERIPKLHETMLFRADAVAAADAASDQVLQKYAAGQTTIATALNSLTREARLTNDLLTTVTRYNLDIAEYALAVVPGSAPRDALVGALVVNRMRR